jgi:hypothetical protein
VISLFVHPSVRLSVCLRSLVGSISSLPLAQSGLYFIHRVPSVKGCAVTLNKVCRSWVKVTLNQAKIFFQDIYFKNKKNMAHYKFLHLYCNCFSALKFIMPQWFSICIHFLMSQNNYFSQFFTTEYVPYPSVILDGRFCLFIQSLMLSGNQISSAN